MRRLPIVIFKVIQYSHILILVVEDVPMTPRQSDGQRQKEPGQQGRLIKIEITPDTIGEQTNK